MFSPKREPVCVMGVKMAAAKAAGMLGVCNGERLSEQMGRASPLCPPSRPRGHRHADLTLPPPRRNASGLEESGSTAGAQGGWGGGWAGGDLTFLSAHTHTHTHAYCKPTLLQSLSSSRRQCGLFPPWRWWCETGGAPLSTNLVRLCAPV